MKRTRVLRGILIAALATIVVRLFFIQVVEHDDWVARANEEHTVLETIAAKRGEIYMMDGDEPVAIVLNQTTYTIVVDPAMTDLAVLFEVLEAKAKEYLVTDLETVKESGLRYYIVAKNVPRTVATEISEEGIAYVWFKEGNSRVYPEGTLASGLLGFVNADGIGQYGVEGSLNQTLSGTDGMLKTIADVNKVALSIGDDNVKTPAVDGENVVLTVDRGIQMGVEEILVEMIEETAATNAAAIVMDPNTGEVLAMANVPNYDPADYGNVEDASAYTNYVTESPYEPASVCKSFIFSAAINEGAMTKDTTYFNNGYDVVDGWKIQNAEQRSSIYGTISMQTALYWSLNTGSMQALRLLGGNAEAITEEGRKKMYDYYYNKFRLGQATGIELIEAEGYILDPVEGDGRDSVYANMTFGQNLSITMVQTAAAFSAVINGGVWRTPYIIEGTLVDGELVAAERTDVVEEQILKEETSTMMREMLENNRNYKVRNGTDPAGYAIGGKSGTAQVVKDGEYDDTMSETVASYIGYGGTKGEKSSYVVMVRFWGEGEYMDGTAVGGGAFDRISNFLIKYMGIRAGE